MNKISNFLWKLFSVTMIFWWNTADKTYAADAGIYTNTNNTRGAKIQLCPRGYYVYSCNGVKIGYRWLQNLMVNDIDNTDDKYSTDNYLVGDESERLNQMRAFFDASGSIKRQNCDITTSANGTNKSTCNSDIENVQVDDKVIKDRDVILGYLCNPKNEAIIGCASCPEGAWVDQSFVREDSYGTSSLLIPGSWEFHTVADCYMTEFEDVTGKYIFVDNRTEIDNVTSGARCYYTNTDSDAASALAGDYMTYTTNAGTSAQNTRYYTANIPTSNKNRTY